ncbi:MAG: alanine--tRNA ligase, partial [Desulfuromonadales bacterium]|nr:alanine--tRNA ligase [Desulfuromonadales bacterium]
MTGNDIRKRFLDYFAKNGHTIVPSSSLVPHNDPTLLFTNAGMNQFKDCFLGEERRDYVRAATSQKCVRAGGKHNDLENVGRTARHHTFFEMLGNFSFGDYFKKEAIAYAWEFLTKELQLDTARLYVTVYTDDDEAADIWHQQEGVPRARISRFEEDNFWSMGDTGPCGPCSEIFWDNGVGTGCGSPECAVGCDCDRYMEIWNNVFMQYNRTADGTLHPLPKPAVDTGMGLERITTVMQKVTSNYDTDLLRTIIAQIEKLTGKSYGDNAENDVSMRVMADHSRATAFLIADGVLPSNEGRGYVLRRIMRRAMRHAKMLDCKEPVLFKTAVFVLQSMAEAYPEMAARTDYVAKVVRNEEERFILTLDNGLRILQDEIAALQRKDKKVIPGDILFKLYDTYGFPIDLTADIVEQDGFAIDEKGFELCMDEQRKKAREHWKGSGEEAIAGIYKQLRDSGIKSVFCGYDETSTEAEITALIHDGIVIDQAAPGSTVEVITNLTPFYGESGGQSGDTGILRSAMTELKVIATRKPLPDLTVHIAQVISGTISKGDLVTLEVDSQSRQATALNHTATHILQAVLIEVLGNHIKQAGSLVTPERLRFDFTHFSAMTAAEINQAEDEVNRRIRENRGVTITEMSADEAIAAGATALFGEKYGDTVRVVRIGEFSMELCGGTHTGAAGDIGLFKIVQESGIAAGVRRIEAVTGENAVRTVRNQETTVRTVAELLKSDPAHLESRIGKLLEQQKLLEREVATLQSRLNAEKSGDLIDQLQQVADIPVLAVRLDGLDGKKLREMSDQLRDKLPSGVIILAGEKDGKAALLVAVSKDLTGRLQAGKIIAELAAVVGGRGGGKPELAQAGGSEPQQIDKALARAGTVI